RVVLLMRLAALYEERLHRPTEAIAAYRAVLAIDDTHLPALTSLERLHGQQGDFSELSLVLSRRIELAEDPAERRRLRFVAAEVFRDQLGDAYESIAQLRAVLDEGGDDREALAALDALYQREDRKSVV